jgi:bifunctional non-homologous end joining protein LigD
MQNPEQINLYFTQGSSDKIYQVQLNGNAHDDAWVVNFQYGRRGHALVSGTKTKVPISFDKAKKAYNKLVSSKLAKGYTQAASGVAYTATEDAERVTGYLPQLLNEVTEDEALALWGTIDMYLQTKHDGERRGVLYSPDEIITSNKKGLQVAIPRQVHHQLKAWHGCSRTAGILDCEDMGDHLVCFDILPAPNLQAPKHPFSVRAELLEICQGLAHELRLTDLIFDIPYQPKTKEDLQKFIIDARNNGEEGIVIRDGAGSYTPGKPSSGGPCWKLKFYASATVQVAAHHDTKRSVSMTIKTGNIWSNIGNCTIPPNHDIPKVGDLIEVKYLYAYPGGSLYQPQYKGLRTDQTMDAANENQLKYKT